MCSFVLQRSSSRSLPGKRDRPHNLRRYFIDSDGRNHGTRKERSATADDPATPEIESAPRACGATRMTAFEVQAIGRVESQLRDLASAPRQADEGAPSAWLAFDADMAEGLRSLRVGDEVLVLTWLDRARRDVLSVHPRGDTSRAEEGVFSTRSPHRPNPIGLHRVEITVIDGTRVRVRHLEAIHGTPIIDVKPILSDDIAQR